MRPRSACFLILLVSPVVLSADYFVSGDGEDDPSRPGSLTQPWRTLDFAVRRVRAKRPGWLSPPSAENTATILLRGGTYYLSRTVILKGARDSFLTIKNYQEEEVILSGGVPLDIDWETDGSVLQAEYAGQCGELYYGDYRMLKARSPNIGQYGPNSHYATGPYHHVAGLLRETESCRLDSQRFSQPCPQENRLGFYLTDEINPDWADLNQTQVLVFHSWINEYARVGSVVDTEDGRRKVLFQEPLGHAPVGEWISSGELRYLVVNNRALLDQPGEFVCTQHGPRARLAFIPPPGAQPGIIPVLASLETVLSIRFTTNVNIQGISFQHATYRGLDTSMNWINAALVTRKASDLRISDCEFSHTEMSGLFISGGSNVIVERNVFTDIGYHGLLCLGNKEFENITVSNNYINGVGITRQWSTFGIFHQGSLNVRINNNEVTRTSGGGMNIIGESFARGERGDDDDYVINVEYNYVHDYGAGITNDFGGLKTGSKGYKCQESADDRDYLAQHCYTHIRLFNNLVRDSWAFHCCDSALYSDAASSKNTFENNLIYGASSGALTFNCGLENEAKNNYVHRQASPASGHQPFRQLWGGCNKKGVNTYTNHHNIYYFDNTNNLTLFSPWMRFDEETVFHSNLYYSEDQADQLKPMFPPDNIPFAELSSSGNVDNKWEDPGFASAANNDYSLADDSPARSLNIAQIRLDNFGIQAGSKPRYLK